MEQKMCSLLIKPSLADSNLHINNLWVKFTLKIWKNITKGLKLEGDIVFLKWHVYDSDFNLDPG